LVGVSTHSSTTFVGGSGEVVAPLQVEAVVPHV
jgi:hypothetical protein